MILPIPSGTRDVLPDEMGELRTLTERLRELGANIERVAVEPSPAVHA